MIERWLHQYIGTEPRVESILDGFGQAAIASSVLILLALAAYILTGGFRTMSRSRSNALAWLFHRLCRCRLSLPSVGILFTFRDRQLPGVKRECARRSRCLMLLRVSDAGPMRDRSARIGAGVRKPSGKEPARGGAEAVLRAYGDLATGRVIATMLIRAGQLDAVGNLGFWASAAAGAKAGAPAILGSDTAFGHDRPVPVCNQPRWTAISVGLAPAVMRYRF